MLRTPVQSYKKSSRLKGQTILSENTQARTLKKKLGQVASRFCSHIRTTLLHSCSTNSVALYDFHPCHVKKSRSQAASMLGKQRPRPLLHCTHTMTRARLSLTPSCLLHMHRITWELLSGMVCKPGMAGSASRARAMRLPYHTAFAPRLH